jgi:hypothetical protein
MTLADTLTGLMPDTITVAALTGLSTDGYGTPTYSTAVSYPARVVGKQTLVRTFEGTEELATTVAWVASTSTFGPTDRYTLPDGSTPVLLAVEAYPNETGIDHVKLMFG